MRLRQYVEEVFPTPPFSFCVPPIWHMLENTVAKTHPKRVCYLITRVIVLYAN